MERSQLDERVRNDMSLIIRENDRLFNYYIRPNVMKKRNYGARKAHKVFILGMLKRERNAKKV